MLSMIFHATSNNTGARCARSFPPKQGSEVVEISAEDYFAELERWHRNKFHTRFRTVSASADNVIDLAQALKERSKARQVVDGNR